jgi:hypothetical protein
MNGKITDAEPGKATAPSGDDLMAQQNSIWVKTAIAEAKEKGLALDQTVVEALVARGERFDRKKMTFLEQYSKAGKDPNEYLRELFAQRIMLTPEDEGKVTGFNKVVRRANSIFKDFPEGLNGFVEAEPLKLLAEKATALAAAISPKKED